MGLAFKFWRGAIGLRGAALVLAALSVARPAVAQTPLLDEIRSGILAHSIERGHSEGGVDVNLEVLFRRPAVSFREGLADILLRPRVHVGASINTIGDTSQIYAGLTWDFKLTERLTLEASFGGAWHDGPTGLNMTDSYGCRFNFRESLSLGYALDNRWTVYATIAHMSNANLCDSNSGISSGGIRFGYKLN